MKRTDLFDTAKPNHGAKKEERICRAQGTRSPARAAPRRRNQHQRSNSAVPLASREEPRGCPHTMPGMLCAWEGATRAHTCCRGCWRAPHACPAAVPAACSHTHVPRRRVTTSNVNAGAGFLRPQVHQSLSSGAGKRLPCADRDQHGQGQHPLPCLTAGVWGEPGEEKQLHPAVQHWGNPRTSGSRWT